MSDLVRAAQQALEAMEYENPLAYSNVIAALRIALDLEQRTRQPLTEEAITEMVFNSGGWVEFARRVERAHGIGEVK